MATNGRPVTRINVNYGSLGTVAESRALNPVFIAPRYILHGHKEGYADAYVGKFDITNNILKDVAWPAAESRGTKIDVSSASLYIKEPFVELNATPIKGTATVNTNEIILDEAIQGANRSDSLGDFAVSVGDRVDITGTAGTVNARITGIGKKAVEAYVDATPAPIKATTTSSIVAGGTFSGGTDSYYLVSIKSVEKDATTLEVKGLSGVDYNYKSTIAGSENPVAIGTVGVTIALKAGQEYEVGDAWKVSAYATHESAACIVYVDRVLESTETAPSCVFSSNYYSPEFAEVSDALTTTMSTVSISDSVSVTIGGVARRVTEGEVYVNYRELVTEGSLSLVSNATEGVSSWAGVADPTNPMGLVYSVASGVSGASFLLMATEGESAEDYIKAINYVAQFETAYAIVPFSNETSVRNAVINVISKYAAPEIAQFKRGWVASTVNRMVDVYTESKGGGTLIGTMEDGVITLSGGNLIEGGVAPGDYAVLGETEYEIYKINSDTAVSVYGGVNASSDKIKFVRKLSNTEYAKAIANEAANINSARINLVWGDGVTALGYSNLPTSVACVALAAQRSALPPHAPMTDMVVPGIYTQDSLKFTDAEYEIMNAGGVWIIHNDSEGNTVTYHQITTKTDGTIAEEDSCVSNGDAVIRYFRTAIKSLFNGSMNVYDELIPTVKSQLVAQAEAIRVIPFADMYGPMLVDFQVIDIYRPDSNKGALVVNCSAEFVRPYAGGEFTFNLI